MLTIDARYLAYPPSGIPRYTRNLLAAIRAADPGRRVRVLIHPDGPPPDPLTNHGRFDFVSDPHRPRDPREVYRWRSRLRKLGPSLLHTPDAFAPLWPGPRVVVTLHDTIPLIPELRCRPPRSRKERFAAAWRWWLKRQVRRADAVLTVSRHSTNDLRRRLNVPENKLHIVPNAVPRPDTSTETETNHTTDRDTPYLLCVGRFEPYKNATGLVEAFARLEGKVRLVFVGPRDPRFPEAEERVAQLGLENRVTFTDTIGDAALHRWYAHAAAVVLPSRYEGFGLPAIEAMQHGVPVVASDAGALPEIVGEAAIKVDTTDTPRFREALTRVLQEHELRDRLIRLGATRAQAFAPKAVGVRYLETLDRIDATIRS